MAEGVNSFNEAGAFPPRKSRGAVDRLETGGFASMRPGRFHPGNPSSATSSAWGHARFNEAGAFPPRKSY